MAYAGQLTRRFGRCRSARYTVKKIVSIIIVRRTIVDECVRRSKRKRGIRRYTQNATPATNSVAYSMARKLRFAAGGSRKTVFSFRFSTWFTHPDRLNGVSEIIRTSCGVYGIDDVQTRPRSPETLLPVRRIKTKR